MFSWICISQLKQPPGCQTDFTLLKQKIEKLQASLHLLGDEDDGHPSNQHVIFVDSEKEGTQYIKIIHVVQYCR